MAPESASANGGRWLELGRVVKQRSRYRRDAEVAIVVRHTGPTLEISVGEPGTFPSQSTLLTTSDVAQLVHILSGFLAKEGC